jgi:hypothetical protein
MTVFNPARAGAMAVTQDIGRAHPAVTARP